MKMKIAIVLSMLFGALLTCVGEVAFLASRGCFVPKAEADARRDALVKAAYWNEVYTRIAVCPQDEMNGEGP